VQQSEVAPEERRNREQPMAAGMERRRSGVWRAATEYCVRPMLRGFAHQHHPAGRVWGGSNSSSSQEAGSVPSRRCVANRCTRADATADASAMPCQHQTRSMLSAPYASGNSMRRGRLRGRVGDATPSWTSSGLASAMPCPQTCIEHSADA